MSRHVVILGAGTGGTLTANRLRRALGLAGHPPDASFDGHTKVYTGTAVTVGEDGFLTDPGQWRTELAPDDFLPEINGIITVGEFHELAAGGQVIVT
ncbi:hypothetical protein [Actinophytocola sp.]|uniref:hypothetical protein n=1 Tax=Actinophytocola sp. TaxID=1872138 RepID=UPI00389A0DAE